MIRKIFLLVIVSVFLFAGTVCAQKEDLLLIGEGKYFTVYGYAGIDVDYLARKLNFDYFLHPDNILGDGSDVRNVFVKTIDAIYLEASDVLDIHSYNFNGRLKIVVNQKGVESAFKAKYGRDFPERSIYLVDEKTIYISAEDMTLGMLGHEISHAIINHYFVVPPSAKMQEILAGYVEYSLNKKVSSPVRF